MDANLISALIGAVIGGIFTSATAWWVTKTAHQNLLLAQRQSQEALIIGLLQGLRTEVETIWDIYKEKFGEAIKLFMAGQPISKKYHLYLYRAYFIVYDSNGSLIGQIPDSALREEIVAGYLKAKELIDAHLHNNKLVEELEHWKTLRKETDDLMYDDFIESANKDLVNHAAYLKAVYLDAESRRGNFLNRDWRGENTHHFNDAAHERQIDSSGGADEKTE